SHCRNFLSVSMTALAVAEFVDCAVGGPASRRRIRDPATGTRAVTPIQAESSPPCVRSSMNGFFWVVSLWVDGFGLGQVPPILLGPNQVQRVNRSLHGQLLAFTWQGGVDHRIWSPALNQRRGMLVYLPPGYDPKKQYPLAL